MAYNVEKLSTIELGRQGENLAKTVEIDVSSLLAQWPEATISLLCKRKHDMNPYIAVTEVRDGILIWPITSVETEIAGEGKIELRAVCGEVIAKSMTASIRVIASLTGSETEPPEAAQGWVAQVLEAGSEAEENARAAQEAAERAEDAAASAAAAAEAITESAQSAQEKSEAAENHANNAGRAAEEAEQNAQRAEQAADTTEDAAAAAAEIREQVEAATNQIIEVASGVQADAAMAEQAAAETEAALQTALSTYADAKRPTGHIGVNLYNRDDNTAGYGVNWNGELFAHQQCVATGFIPVNELILYQATSSSSNTTGYCVCYDKDKHVIGNGKPLAMEALSSPSRMIYTLPAGTKYTRHTLIPPSQADSFTLSQYTFVPAGTPFGQAYIAPVPQNLVSTSDIADTTGASEKAVMSQKAVTTLSNAFPKSAASYKVVNPDTGKEELTIGDIKEGGYYVLSTTYDLLDAPANCAYKPTALIVENFRLGNGNSFNRQTLSTVTEKPVADYVRVSNNNGVWTDWVKVTISGMEIVTQNSLPRGTDVNTVTESKSWLVTDTANLVNVPAGYESRAGYFMCMRHSNNWCLQLLIPFSGSQVFRRSGNNGNWNSWTVIGGNTETTEYNNTYNHTYVTEEYTVTATPAISENAEYHLTAIGDETDVSASIAALLETVGVCRLGPGDFYVSGITLPDRGILTGCGAKTRLILLGSVTDGHAVKLGNYCTVKDLSILGSTSSIGLSGTVGTRHGIVFEGNADAEDGVIKVLPRTGIIENVRIDNFTGGGITCCNTGYSHANSLTVSDCVITGCRAGINIAYWSEYHRFTNVLCYGCYYGCINNGGNNMFSNCSFTGNKLGFLMDNADGSQRNTAHGSVVCCTFNHTDGNAGTGIKIVNTANGYVFSGCQIFYSKIELKDAQGIVFDGFNFGRNEGISVDGGGTVLFTNCVYGSAPVVTVNNNNHVQFINCYTRAGVVITH